MTNNDRARFARAMTLLSEMFDKQVTDVLAAVYFDACRDLSIEEFEAATKAALGGCRYFPKPVELLELAHGTEEDRALSAWLIARSAASSVGSYGRPEFDDENIPRTIRALGGWVAFCVSEEPEDRLRRRFVEYYRIQERQALGLPSASRAELPD